MTDQDRLINFAIAEVGYKETPKNITKYSAYFEGTDFYNGSKGNGKTWGVEWCDIFVDYCFCNVFGMETARNMLYQPKRSCGAGCKFSAGYYKSAKKFYTVPKPGDQIFFIVGSDINHTGIVTKVTKSRIYTVEGNSNNAVQTHSYALDNKNIAGYGRPDYHNSVDVPSTELTEQIINDLANRVIRGEFGNGIIRKQKLNSLGYGNIYNKVQSEVNRILKKK